MWRVHEWRSDCRGWCSEKGDISYHSIVCDASGKSSNLWCTGVMTATTLEKVKMLQDQHEEKVLTFRGKLQLNIRKGDIEAAHWLGRRQQKGWSWGIISFQGESGTLIFTAAQISWNMNCYSGRLITSQICCALQCRRWWRGVQASMFSEWKNLHEGMEW